MAKSNWRVGKKFWKEARKCWYCMIYHPDGKRQERRLDPDEETAESKRQDIIKQVRNQGVPSLECTVNHLVQSFLTYVEDNNSRATYKWYTHFLLAWKNSPGIANLRVGDVKLHHAQNWLKKAYPQTGNSNTRHDAIAALKRLFNWAVDDMEYLPRNPFTKLKKPRRTERDVCPSLAQWDEILGRYDPDDPFGDFLTVMVETGCRPQELRIMEARHVDFKAQPAPTIHFTDGEIPGGNKGGHDVLLTDKAVAVLRRLALVRPEGPLFRNAAGRAWTKDALNCRFQRLKKTVPFKVNCYAARHSYATDALEKGASIGDLQAQMGIRDPKVIWNHYGKHIQDRTQHLKDMVNRTRPPREEGGDQAAAG